MNLISGQIEEIYVHEGMTMGKVNVRGAFLRVPLTFLMDAKISDTIVIESGVAISKTEPGSQPTTVATPPANSVLRGGQESH
jgi:hydrogenase maturation factor